MQQFHLRLPTEFEMTALRPLTYHVVRIMPAEVMMMRVGVQ